MSATFKGNPNQALLPEYDFAPRLPPVKIVREQGTRDYIITRATTLRNLGYRVNARQVGDSPIWEIAAQLEESQPTPENTHELRANLLNPDIKSNLVLQAQFEATYGAGTAAKLIAAVESYADAIRAAEDPPTTYTTTVSDMATTGPFIADGAALAIDLLDELLLGADTFVDSQPVYVHTFQLGVNDFEALDFSNVGKIFTTGQLIIDEGVPTSLGLTKGFGDWEWLKMRPEKVVSIGQGETIKYEYWGAKNYSRLRYESATFPT